METITTILKCSAFLAIVSNVACQLPLVAPICSTIDGSYSPINDASVGQKATPAAFPWLFNLNIYHSENDDPRNCSAYLVKNRWLLTAAHCVVDAETIEVAMNRQIFFGLWQTNTIANISSDSVYIYPEFVNGNHDIALIKLPSTVNETNNIVPICVLNDEQCQESSNLFQRNSANCGDPFTIRRVSKLSQTPELEKINRNVIGQRLCENTISNGHSIGPNQFCAIGNNCQVGSAEPLMCKFNGTTAIVGIGSFGNECDFSQPGVYTRICHYKYWISEVTKELGCRMPLVPNSMVMISGTSVNKLAYIVQNTAISIVCNQYYQHNVTFQMNSIIARCYGNNRWTANIAPCVPTSCGALPLVGNGTFTASSHSIGSIAILTCDPGYFIIGNSTVECLTTAKWSVPTARCLPPPTFSSCPVLPQITNGYIEDGNDHVGATRSINCFDGFQYSGPSPFITCKPNGQWTVPDLCFPCKFSTIHVFS